MDICDWTGFPPVQSLSTPMHDHALAMATCPDDPGDPGAEAALDWADVAAMLGEFQEALAWLDYIESSEGPLPPQLAARRQAWIAGAQHVTHHSA